MSVNGCHARTRGQRRFPKGMLAALLVQGCIGALQAAGAAESSEPPTLILHGAKVYTPAGWKEAVAVKGERILATGANQEILALRGPRTRVIDLHGHALLPGLHDSHVHPFFAGAKMRECTLAPGATARQLLDTVAKCVAHAHAGEWVVGGGWDMTGLDAPPTRQMLDQVAPDNPVMLSDFSFHSRWINSRAMSAAGITRTTPNPDGGVIARDANGEATGIVSENATALVEAHIPQPDLALAMADMQAALNIMLSQGITSFADAWANEQVMEVYQALDRKGELKQRVTGCRRFDPDSVLTYEQLKYSGRRFAPDCIKLFLDGVPLTPRTASVLVPYVGMEHDPAHAYGLLLWKQEQLNTFVTLADRAGFQIKMHAAGDGAVRQAVKAVQAAREANGYRGRMHSVAHIGWLGDGDADIARRSGAALEFSPYVWYTSPGNEVVRGVVGDERMKGWYPVREAIDTHNLVLAGSDWPVVPSVNPWLGMETLVTRKAPGNEGVALAPAHAITLKEAFDIYTANAATYEGKRTALGAIEAGLWADMIVTDRNPFEVPVGDVHNTKVVGVFINGEEVLPIRIGR